MTLGTHLSFWPALLFGYLEPVMLVAGWHSAYYDTKRFVNVQTPTLIHATPDANTLTFTYVLGNIYILLALFGFLNVIITRDARVTKWYLIFVAIGDLGHIYACYLAMGQKAFLNFNDYTDAMWGNIGVSAFLHVNRLATVAGLFGRIGGRS